MNNKSPTHSSLDYSMEDDCYIYENADGTLFQVRNSYEEVGLGIEEQTSFEEEPFQPSSKPYVYKKQQSSSILNEQQWSYIPADRIPNSSVLESSQAVIATPGCSSPARSWSLLGPNAGPGVLLNRRQKSSVNKSLSSTSDSIENLASSPTNEEHDTRKTWSDNAIRILISEYKNSMPKFRCNTIKNDDVWKSIVGTLKDNGFKYSVIQTSNKWKYLRKLYMKELENKGPKSTGQGNYTFEYFDEMDEIFSDSPAITPVNIASSSRGSNLQDVVTKSFNKKRKNEDDVVVKVSKKSAVIKWLEENYERRDKQIEKRHEENLSVKRQAIDSFTAIMNKFIEKL